MAASSKRKSSSVRSNGYRTKRKKMNSEIFGILFFGISVLICIGVFFKESTGLLGTLVGGLIFSLFGIYLGFIIPILLVAVSIMLLFQKGRFLIARKGIPVSIFVILICGLFSTVNSSGGLIGGLISNPLKLLFAATGTYIVLAILILIDFVVITGLSVLSGLRWLFKNLWLLILSIIEKIKDFKTNSDSDEAGLDSKKKIKLTGTKKGVSSDDDSSDFVQEVEPTGKPTYNISGMGFDDRPEPQPLTPLEEKQIIETLNNSVTTRVHFDYTPPDFSFLAAPINQFDPEKEKRTISEDSKKLEATLKSFGVEAKVINVTRGPAVTRYELSPAPGVKVSRIVNLVDDIALNLASQGVRIEAPIPGKAAVGIEVPNADMAAVYLVELLQSREFQNFDSKVAFAVGKGLSGEIVIADISKMPHLLIAGATGAGKSVCINSLIMSLLYKASPDEVKLLMVDPKVVELGVYNGIPHLLIPVVTDPRKAAGALNWAVQEMVNRYKLFAEKGVRDIKGYNDLIEKSGEGEKFPLIVIIIDELADLMMVAPNEVEDSICRLAQMARAAGMHLVIATQRPSVDVITGIIKANIPSRLSFAVTSQVDSRTILDMGGAEKLLGKGDMLFHPSGIAKPVRIKGCLVTDKEVERVVKYVKSQGVCVYDDAIINHVDKDLSSKQGDAIEDDELLPRAIDFIVSSGQASVSVLQRKFKVGYARAARMIDQIEARGIIGGYEGSKPRQILITKNDWLEMNMNNLDEGENQ